MGFARCFRFVRCSPKSGDLLAPTDESDPANVSSFYDAATGTEPYDRLRHPDVDVAAAVDLDLQSLVVEDHRSRSGNGVAHPRREDVVARVRVDDVRERPERQFVHVVDAGGRGDHGAGHGVLSRDELEVVIGVLRRRGAPSGGARTAALLMEVDL